jgi:hypothetical protein
MFMESRFLVWVSAATIDAAGGSESGDDPTAADDTDHGATSLRPLEQPPVDSTFGEQVRDLFASQQVPLAIVRERAALCRGELEDAGGDAALRLSEDCVSGVHERLLRSPRADQTTLNYATICVHHP